MKKDGYGVICWTNLRVAQRACPEERGAELDVSVDKHRQR